MKEQKNQSNGVNCFQVPLGKIKAWHNRIWRPLFPLQQTRRERIRRRVPLLWRPVWSSHSLQLYNGFLCSWGPYKLCVWSSTGTVSRKRPSLACELVGKNLTDPRKKHREGRSESSHDARREKSLRLFVTRKRSEVLNRHNWSLKKTTPLEFAVKTRNAFNFTLP